MIDLFPIDMKRKRVRNISLKADRSRSGNLHSGQSGSVGKNCSCYDLITPFTLRDLSQVYLNLSSGLSFAIKINGARPDLRVCFHFVDHRSAKFYGNQEITYAQDRKKQSSQDQLR